MPDNSLTQNLIKCPGISSYPLLLVFFREFIIEVISRSETGEVKTIVNNLPSESCLLYAALRNFLARFWSYVNKKVIKIISHLFWISFRTTIYFDLIQLVEF